MILKSTVACTVISLSILWYIICSAILQLLFLFFCFCSGAYALINTFSTVQKGKPMQCLICLTVVALGGSKTRMQISSAPFFFNVFLFTKNTTIQLIYNFIRFLFQYIKHFSISALILGSLPCVFL